MKNASVQELQELVDCYQAVDADEFFEWLVGPESCRPCPTEEYCAFACLTMAIDLAKVLMARR